jgi:nickel/cobalt exporter
MNNFTTLLQQGNAWLFVPSAILLGALHGLEPGHSKTMMAAFIVAVRGTVKQAVLLGLAATFSHTAVVWLIALGGLYFGQRWDAETSEPYMQVASAVLMVGVALWVLWRTWQQQRSSFCEHGAEHSHTHDEAKRIDTGHGVVRLEVFEGSVPPRFRLFFDGKNGHTWTADQVRVVTERPEGNCQSFTFVQRDGFVESEQEIPEPHKFLARVSLGHERHSHDYAVEFVEHSHDHHAIKDNERLDVVALGYQDPHELAHASDIRRRFTNRDVTTGQIILFGLTGGLIPCPASITVLLLCLQLKKIALGATIVMSFSVGLALTMVASGTLAALSVKHVSKRWSGFGEFARKAPYISGAMIMLIGLYIVYRGFIALH